MNMKTILLTVLALTATSAAADVRMTFATSDGPDSEIAIKGDRIRMGGGGRSGTRTLFDASSERMTVVDDADKSYYHMDAEAMKRQNRQMSEQMRQAREQMEQQLENMPEEQREMMRKQMEQMMPEQQGADAGGEIRIERSGNRASVAGVECEVVTALRDGTPAQRVCVAPAGELGLSSANRGALQKMFGFLREMAVSFEGSHMGARVPARLIREFDGIPVRSEDLQGGSSWELQSIRDADVAASEFEIPSGYTETDPFAMQQ